MPTHIRALCSTIHLSPYMDRHHNQEQCKYVARISGTNKYIVTQVFKYIYCQNLETIPNFLRAELFSARLRALFYKQICFFVVVVWNLQYVLGTLKCHRQRLAFVSGACVTCECNAELIYICRIFLKNDDVKMLE